LDEGIIFWPTKKLAIYKSRRPLFQMWYDSPSYEWIADAFTASLLGNIRNNCSLIRIFQEELYFDREIDEEKFIHYGNEILDGVAIFWSGLEVQRKVLME